MTKKTRQIALVPGDDTWKKLRKKYTVSKPGKYSSLYYLNAELMGLEDKVPMTFRAHWAMCLFVEGMTGIPEIDSARVKAAFVPRGTGKSTLITKGKTIHDLLRFDDYAVGIANENQENANDFLKTIKLEFERNEMLRVLFPERVPEDFSAQTWKADKIEIRRKGQRRDPSVLATGVSATVTGAHPNTWILDDLISKNAAEAARRGNFNEIEKANQWVTEMQPMMGNPMRDPITVVATYWWEGDTYKWMEGDEEMQGFWGYGEPAKVFRWNLILPDGTKQTIMLRRRGDIAIFQRSIFDEFGHSWFPERMTDDELKRMEMQDPEFFASQYRLDPVSNVTREFSKDWLRTYEVDGESVRYRDNSAITRHVLKRDLAVVISVDAAFSDKNTSARTAIIACGIHEDKIFLLEDFAERGQDVYDIAAKVAEFAQRYNPLKVFVETTAQQAAVSAVIQKEAKRLGLNHLPVEDIARHSEPNKIIRVYGLGPFFRAGRFFHRADQTRFLGEYLSFPRNRVRDVLDALSFQRDEWEKIANMQSTKLAKGQQDASLGRFQRSMARISGRGRQRTPATSRWL